MPRFASPFEDVEETTPPETTPQEPAYVFDGYTIDFSTKVMLTPVVPVPKPKLTGVSQSRRRR